MRAYPCREWNSPRLKPGHTTAAARVCTAAAAHVLVEFNGDVYESDSCLVETPAFLLFYGETFLCEFWWAFFCFSCYISVDRENSGLVYLLPTGGSLLCSNSTLNFLRSFLSKHKIVAWIKMRARQSYHHESYGKNLASFTQDDTFFCEKRNEILFKSSKRWMSSHSRLHLKWWSFRCENVDVGSRAICHVIENCLSSFWLSQDDC